MQCRVTIIGIRQFLFCEYAFDFQNRLTYSTVSCLINQVDINHKQPGFNLIVKKKQKKNTHKSILFTLIVLEENPLQNHTASESNEGKDKRLELISFCS